MNATKDMIEESVARAVYERGRQRHFYTTSWENLGPLVKEEWLEDATAAISAHLTALKARVEYHVIAYDESGYGDNRSRQFDSAEEAIEYARSLEKRFCANAYKVNVIPEKRESSPLWLHSDERIEGAT